MKIKLSHFPQNHKGKELKPLPCLMRYNEFALELSLALVVFEVDTSTVESDKDHAGKHVVCVGEMAARDITVTNRSKKL